MRMGKEEGIGKRIIPPLTSTIQKREIGWGREEWERKTRGKRGKKGREEYNVNGLSKPAGLSLYS